MSYYSTAACHTFLLLLARLLTVKYNYKLLHSGLELSHRETGCRRHLQQPAAEHIILPITGAYGRVSQYTTKDKHFIFVDKLHQFILLKLRWLSTPQIHQHENLLELLDQRKHSFSNSYFWFSSWGNFSNPNKSSPTLCGAALHQLKHGRSYLIEATP